MTKKLTNEDKQNIVTDIKSGTDKLEILKKYGITARQYRIYEKRVPDNKPVAEPLTVNPEPGPIPEPSPEPEDYSAKDLLGDEPQDPINNDPDLCAECHRNGKATELTKGQATCHVCGVYLQWEQ